MQKTKEGFFWHDVSKHYKDLDEGETAFRRKVGDRIVIDVPGPVWVAVPVTLDVQEECFGGYSTKIGGQAVRGIAAVVARFSLHNFESKVAEIKDEIGNDVMYSTSDLQAKLDDWVPGQKRAGKVREISKSKLEGLKDDPEALMAYLSTIGKIVD